MTLIICKKINKKIIFYSDTLIAGPDKFSFNDNTYHGLKAFFIGRQFCIAYSGIQEYAHKIIKIINDNKNSFNKLKDIAELICHLRNIHSNNVYPKYSEFPDFIVASNDINDNIIEIKGNKQPVTITNSSWIGNFKAFEYFQLIVNENKNIELSNDAFDYAFRKVIENPQLSDVGGNLVTIIGDDKGFHYQSYLNLTSPNYEIEPPIPSKEDPEWLTVQWGSNVTGGYGFTSITPIENNINSYGIYYFQGKFGFLLYCDLDNDKCEKLVAKAPSVQDFINILYEETNIKFEYCGFLT
ncbi:hypothetical protein [Leptospira terpstrae]|nr:hypothetical protein [Leptospira terpstrae]